MGVRLPVRKGIVTALPLDTFEPGSTNLYLVFIWRFFKISIEIELPCLNLGSNFWFKSYLMVLASYPFIVRVLMGGGPFSLLQEIIRAMLPAPRNLQENAL